MTRNSIRIITLALVCFVVLSSVAVYAGGNLSRRRAAARGSSKTYSNRMRPTRRALGAQVRKGAPMNNSHGRYNKDSYGRRAVSTVFKLDARGGGVHNMVGQHMGRNGNGRSANNWRNGVGYAVNAGRAARYLGYALGR